MHGFPPQPVLIYTCIYAIIQMIRYDILYWWDCRLLKLYDFFLFFPLLRNGIKIYSYLMYYCLEMLNGGEMGTDADIEANTTVSRKKKTARKGKPYP